MLTSTIVLRGKVVAEDVLFSWWVTDGPTPRLTVSHQTHGTETQPLSAGEPWAQARLIAQAMLARKARAAQADVADDIDAAMPDGDHEATVVLGDDYRRDVEHGFSDERSSSSRSSD